MGESISASEFYEDPPMNVAGGQAKLQELSSAEIMELYQRDRRIIYLFDRAREREVVEAAEQILQEVTDDQSNNKEEQ